MIVLDVVQGTTEWLNARLGIPTASNFSRILTAKTRKPSSSSDKFMCELIAERLLGRSVNDASTDFMLRGTALEADAVAAYEFDNDVETVQVGFVLDDSRRWGCSPDRLVGDDGSLEVKCLGAANHVAALLGMLDDDHAAQVQGQMFVTGRAWTDLLFYNPDMPTHTVRIARDEVHIAALAAAVPAFCDRLDAAHAQLIRSGDAATDAAGTDAAPDMEASR